MTKLKLYELKLDSHGIPLTSGKYIRLPSPFEPYVLRFNLQGASGVCRNGKFLTNYPFEGQDYSRPDFYQIPLKPDFSKAIHIDIWITRPGAYAYKIEYEPLPDWDPIAASSIKDDEPIKTTTTEEHYFCVEPALTLNGKDLPLSGLAIQSVTGKWLGPLKSWPQFFKVFRDKGYNMIHFTPLNHRGDSNSPYSIYNQLAFAPDIFEPGTTIDEQHVQINEMTDRMEKEFGLLSLTDVVWNHTAENSDWLQDHPEAGYNLHNSPHLIAAYQLDSALLDFSSNLRNLGYPSSLYTMEDLLKLMEGIKTHVLGGCRLWEFYVVDVTRHVEDTINVWKEGAYVKGLGRHFNCKNSSIEEKCQAVKGYLLRDDGVLGERFKRTIDNSSAACYLYSLFGEYKAENVTNAQRELMNVFNEINLPFYKEFDADRETILESLFNRIKYVRLDLKQPEISESHPLIETLFTRLPHNERTLKHPKGSLAVANNGWIWANNPLVDFAGPNSKAYLRREVIVWGDCVKLRYGKGPEDNPWLWKHMTEYTQLMATHFHGFRIDNCHSTPLHVGAYLLDVARSVRSDIYICAELFTGSEEMDVVFCSHLGINSLIREAMSAWDPQELSRLVHRHGGKPIGSLDTDALVVHGTAGSRPADIYPLTNQPINPLFFDCTHDNETPNQKRVPQDTLPTGALVAMCAAATGSVMGYDEIFPRLLNLVSEERLYAPEADQPGIGKTKSVLNRLHEEMACEGYTETHIHHEGEYITVHRVCPQTHRGYFLIAHTAFHGGLDRGQINPIVLTGTKAEVMLCQRLNVFGIESNDPKYLRGLPSRVEDLQTPHIDHSKNGQTDTTTITVPDFFPPGSICLMKTWVEFYDESVDSFLRSDADKAMSELTLTDLNVLLYRCEGEERDLSKGEDGAYGVPGYGSLTYCGLQGWIYPLQFIIRDNDLAHAVCNHLRNGTWALDYNVTRLRKFSDYLPNLAAPEKWLAERFKKVKTFPSFLCPKLFAIVIQTAYNAAKQRSLEVLSETIRDGSEFIHDLALTSIQLQGIVNSTSLNPKNQVPCLAAGLPFFSYDYMRCWGRDIFISARGLFLGTGRYDDAKEHILAFAAMLKHGMIPNLLDAGRRPRYNSRDSVWFFLQLIQDYCKTAPDGRSILSERVKRRFPLDDEFIWPDNVKAYSYDSSIMEIVQEVLSRHANGLAFREAHAGFTLDSQMSDQGFNINIHVDWTNGLVFGGSRYNCGTWMDKMGESQKAGNKGVPGTPRDGASIEITGLLKSALRWVSELWDKKIWKWEGVTIKDADGSEKFVSFKKWNDRIQESFERCYYIPKDEIEDVKHEVNRDVVKRRGIYKDLYRSSEVRWDHQFRPNFAICMTVAPELFDPVHALECLALADKVLRGPTGMRTLDPEDEDYRPYYINSDDSDDFRVAKGRNYHQGPEWLWCTGFFLRAFLKFDLPRRKTKAGKIETLQQLHARLYEHRKMIQDNPWIGLVELTNKDGAECYDACKSQAWSMGTLLDLMHDTSLIDM